MPDRTTAAIASHLLDIGKDDEAGSVPNWWQSTVGKHVADIDQLTALIEPHVRALGLDLVRVAMFGGKTDPTLQVMAERRDTRQLLLDDCATLSRALSEMLDAEDPIEEAYRLEVSSPGIDRPLTRLADYVDWAGFDARLRLSEAVEGRKQIDCRLHGIDGESVIVMPEKADAVMVIPFALIRTAKLILTDALIAATVPLLPDDADTVLTEG